MRILVILLSRLGDMVQATPALEALRALHPEARLEVMALDEAVEVLRGLPVDTVWPLPARHLPHLDAEVLECCRRGQPPALAAQVLEALALPGYDRVINLDCGPLAGWFTANLAATDRQGGLVTADGRRLYRGAWHAYLFAEIAAREANLFNLVDLWRGAVGAPSPPSGSRPRAPIAPELPFPLPPGRRVALNPGAAEPWRRWPANAFAALAVRLRARGFTPLLTGSPADRDLCSSIAQNLSPPLPDFAGRTSVAQMTTLLGHCDLLVSNDTGAVHLAAAAATPVIGLYGPIPYFRMTAPWSEGNIILRRPGATPDAPGAPLPVELVDAAAAARLGALPELELATILNRHGAEAWESRFLPAGADPLGGLAWRPLHPHLETAEDLYRLALRAGLAARLSGLPEAPAPRPAGLEIAAAPDLGNQLEELAGGLHPWLDLWQQWSRLSRRQLAGNPGNTLAAHRAALLLLARTEEVEMPSRASLRLLMALLARRASFLVTDPVPAMLAGFEQECRFTSEIATRAFETVRAWTLHLTAT